MKRIEAIVQADKLKSIVDALEGKVGGFIAFDGKGRGSGARPTVRMGRGTGTMKADFNTVASIVSIVDDSDVKTVVDAITEAAYTGTAGDGIIVVSTVDDVANITTKKKGSEAL